MFTKQSETKKAPRTKLLISACELRKKGKTPRAVLGAGDGDDDVCAWESRNITCAAPRPESLVKSGVIQQKGCNSMNLLGVRVPLRMCSELEKNGR